MPRPPTPSRQPQEKSPRTPTGSEHRAPPRASSLRDEQKALTRRRLFDAAEVVFAQRGYHGASVEEIAREAGATTGALYSNFASKEDLFLGLFERIAAADVLEYAEAVSDGASAEAEVRGVADVWMQILHERPYYFPLVIEFWAYAIREPRLREPLAARFRAFDAVSAQLILAGARQQGIVLSDEFAERLGLMITSLGNGLALQKLLDPEAVSDETYGEMLTLIFSALEVLAAQDTTTGAEADV
jgi:AcrR family transcriptional regulator